MIIVVISECFVWYSIYILLFELYVATFLICVESTFSVWDVFNKFLLLGATDRTKKSDNQKWLFIAITPFIFRKHSL